MGKAQTLLRKCAEGTGVGCGGFHPNITLDLTKETGGIVVEFLDKVEQSGTWPQQACTAIFFLIPKNVASVRPIALVGSRESAGSGNMAIQVASRTPCSPPPPAARPWHHLWMVTATTSTSSRASARRSRASSPPALTRVSNRRCFGCMITRAPGVLTRGSQNSAMRSIWLWRLDPHHGSVLEPEDYVDSFRLRLGCAGPSEPVPCVACQTGSLDTAPATTRPPHQFALLPSPAITPLRPRFPASSLALRSGPPTCSPPPLATRALPWTSRPALRTLSNVAQTARNPGSRPNLFTTAHTFPPSSDRTSPTPRSSGAPVGDLTRTL